MHTSIDMKKLFFSLLGLLSIQLTHAQNVVDLVRYSNLQLQGSARFESMGGSFGALGADMSSSLINPAGYGRFSSSQFQLGANFYNVQNTANFQGINTETSRNPVRPASAGVVFVIDKSTQNKGFLYSQFGFSYNRVDNLTNTLGYKGKLYNSILDGFATDANGLAPNQLSPFSSALAYETYAIDPDGNGGYVPRLTIYDTMYHKRSVESKGGISEYTFSYSTNYLNKLYFGINWGIRTARYTENYTHREQLENATLSLDSITYNYSLQTRGSGNNFKIGVIYLPFEALRLGISLHTPTYYNLTDNWSASMQSFHGDTTYSIESGQAPTANYKYRLRTPAKVVGSIAYVFGTRGCINIDMEYLNYASANLKTTKDASYAPADYRLQNDEADDLLRSVVNVRVGGEMVFQSQYFLRGGFAYYPQPYKEAAANGTKATTVYSVGGGIKFGRSTLDLAYKIQNKDYNYYAFAGSLTKIKSVSQGIVISYALSF